MTTGRIDRVSILGRPLRARQFVLIAGSVTFWLLAAVCAIRLLVHGNASGSFVLLTWAAAIYATAIYAVDIFIVEQRSVIFGASGAVGLVRLLFASLLCGVVLEAFTLIGSPLSSPLVLSDWGLKRTVVFISISFVSLVLLCGRKGIFRSASLMRSAFPRSAIDKRDLCFLSVATAVLIAILGCLASSFGLSLIPVAIFGAAILLPLAIIVTSRAISKIPEWVFISIALPIGLVLCIFVPPMTGASWDDQIHYKNALDLSYLTSPEITIEEQRMSEMALRFASGTENDLDLALWSSAGRRSYEQTINEGHAGDIEAGNILKRYYPDQLLSFVSLGYTPSAVGLWVGRLLHLPLAATVVLGRIFNLLTYCTVCFIAIRISPVKKVLFAVVSLIPENIFLAANYSYDPWLTSMILLGIAVLFREMWGNDGPLEFSRVAIASLILFLGLGVKAVYFPIIGLFFLMPSSKFADKSQRFRYYLFVVLFGLFVLASFAMPFLFNVGVGAETGDQRGGSDVSSSGQLAFILGNPVRYAMILKAFFVAVFFNPIYASGYLFSFSYLSNSSPVELSLTSFNNPAVNLVPVLFLIGIALFDNEDGGAWRHAGKGSTAWAAVIYLGTYILVATALYISFTPVGHETVNGCQLRYQLPILAPMLAVLLNYGKPLGFKDGTKKVIYLVSLFCLLFWTFVFVVSKCVV